MKSSKRIIELHESVPKSRNIALVCLSASDLHSRATCNSVAKMIRGVVGGKGQSRWAITTCATN